MRIEVESTDDGFVALQNVEGEVFLFTPERAEVEANHWQEPFRSRILEAVDEAEDIRTY